jgi:hypothetical protein
MPVIDRSEEIDIDIGVPTEKQEIQQEEKKIPANPIFEDMEEEEVLEDSEEELEVPEDFKIKFKSEKEERYYASLTDEEKEAWKGGWRGKLFKGFYKDGTPKPYKTAAEFLQFQKNHTPVLNERNRKLAAEKTALEKKVEEMQRQMNVMLNVQKLAYEEKTQSRFQSLDEAEEAAILEGDVAKVRAIQKQRLELEKNKVSFEEPQVEEPKKEINPGDKEVFDEWAPDNTWFYESAPMRGYAETYFATLSERIPLRERLEMVTEEIQSRFSDKLGISKAPRVESGQRGVQVGKRQYSYNDLPADVRKACDFMAKKHRFTKEQVTKMQQEAVKEYFN